jgi:hypothetical protein
MTDWKFKHKPHAIVSLEKQPGDIVQVRIEGVECSKHTDWQPMYLVREVASGEGYPALESSLRRVT